MQWIFEVQSISASFIVNHVISINLITPMHTDALIPTKETRPRVYDTRTCNRFKDMKTNLIYRGL
jgi:hypothetical protein